VYAAKMNYGISATAAADCIAPNWPGPHEKSIPCDSASRQNHLSPPKVTGFEKQFVFFVSVLGGSC